MDKSVDKGRLILIQINISICRWILTQMIRKIIGSKGSWIDRQMDSETDGQKDRWKERYMERQIDGEIDR